MKYKTWLLLTLGLSLLMTGCGQATKPVANKPRNTNHVNNLNSPKIASNMPLACASNKPWAKVNQQGELTIYTGTKKGCVYQKTPTNWSNKQPWHGNPLSVASVYTASRFIPSKSQWYKLLNSQKMINHKATKNMILHYGQITMVYTVSRKAFNWKRSTGTTIGKLSINGHLKEILYLQKVKGCWWVVNVGAIK